MQEKVQRKNGLIYALIFMLFVNIGRIQELFTFLVPLRLGILSVFIALLLFCVNKNHTISISIFKFPQVRMVLGLWALCLVFVPFSVYKGASFTFAIMRFPVLIMFFLLLVFAVNDFSDLLKVLWAFIFSVFLLAIFNIISSGDGRLTASSFYDPNDIAMLYVITLPIIYFFMSISKGLNRIILFVCFLTILVALTHTVSRGGFIGLVIISVLIFLKDSYRSWIYKIIVLGLLVFAFLQFTPDTYWERIRTIMNVEDDYNMTSKSGRKNIWLGGLNLIMENPVTGVGANAFMSGLGHSYGPEGGPWKTAHNAFIQIGAELGVGGLLLFIILIATSICSLRRLRIKYIRSSGKMREHLWLITALEISLWGYVVTATFLSAAYFHMFYFIIALCCILKKMDDTDQAQEQPLENNSGFKQSGMRMNA